MSRSNQIPQYTAGTIAISYASGVWTATGSGTLWTAPDGVTNWTIAVGDRIVCHGAEGIVGAINSDTSITLSMWGGGVIAAGASYVINRYSGIAPGTLGGLLNNVLAQGSYTNPHSAVPDGGTLPNFAALVGSGKIGITSDGSGNVLIQVRSSAAGQTDANFVTALTINETTGVVTVNGTGTSMTPAQMFAAAVADLPHYNPHSAGALWINGEVLSVSQG